MKLKQIMASEEAHAQIKAAAAAARITMTEMIEQMVIMLNHFEITPFYTCVECSKELDHLIGKETELEVSSSDFFYCSLCNNYNEIGPTILECIILHARADECDCGENIQHNNGGNYHITSIKALVVGIRD